MLFIRWFQQHQILECLATWRDTNGLAKLVDNVLGNSEQGNLGREGVHIKEKNKNDLMSNNASTRL